MIAVKAAALGVTFKVGPSYGVSAKGVLTFADSTKVKTPKKKNSPWQK
jgi:hypothetical protein